MFHWWNYYFSYPTAINLISLGKVQPSSFITHHFSLNNIKDAFETLMDPNKNAIKVVVKCQDLSNTKSSEEKV